MTLIVQITFTKQNKVTSTAVRPKSCVTILKSVFCNEHRFNLFMWNDIDENKGCSKAICNVKRRGFVFFKCVITELSAEIESYDEPRSGESPAYFKGTRACRKFKLNLSNLFCTSSYVVKRLFNLLSAIHQAKNIIGISILNLN